MFKQANPLFLIVETPLHAGSGTELGIVDLPIQREKHTNYPKIEASGIKGGIREIFRTQPDLSQLRNSWDITSVEDAKYKEAIKLAFGPERDGLYAGALGFTDARLLLFPVKSVAGVFGWITCPAVLERFKHDLSICQPTSINFVDNLPGSDTTTTDNCLKVKVEENQQKIVLEEYTFTVTPDSNCDAVANWIADNVFPSEQSAPSHGYWQKKVRQDIVVLSNDDFRDFVTLSTEVIARIKIDQETGTVDKKIGGLWYEEYLPTDSILYSLALTSPIFKERADEKGLFRLSKAAKCNESEKVMNFFKDGLPDVIQLGGNATIGKGIVRTRVYGN